MNEVEQLKIAVGSLLTIFLGVFGARKIWFRDSKEKGDGDRHSTLLDSLISERNAALADARAAWAQRTDDAIKIARLEADNRHMHGQLHWQELRIKQLEQRVAKITGVADSGYADLPPEFAPIRD